MYKLLTPLVLLFSFCAFAEQNENPLPISSVKFEFNSAWQQIEKLNPNGTTWPSRESKQIIYTVPANQDMANDTIPVKLVDFVFSQDNKLNIVFIHFNYSERDSVKNMVTLALGEPQSSKEEQGEKRLGWTLADGRFVALHLGLTPLSQWVYVGISGVFQGSCRVSC